MKDAFGERDLPDWDFYLILKCFNPSIMKTTSTFSTGRILILLLLVTIPMACMAQKKTDFTGNWKLNQSESKLNPERSFAPFQINIKQEGNTMNLDIMNTFQGETRTRSEKVLLDGTESKNQGFGDRESVSVASWDDAGKILTIVTSMERRDGGTMKIIRKYSMVSGSLHVQNSMEGGRGDSQPETWVFNKE
jgi:hypothetical protein